jgi:hypothetical protein
MGRGDEFDVEGAPRQNTRRFLLLFEENEEQDAARHHREPWYYQADPAEPSFAL